jgi:hypothetical protein
MMGEMRADNEGAYAAVLSGVAAPVLQELTVNIVQSLRLGFHCILA